MRNFRVLFAGSTPQTRGKSEIPVSEIPVSGKAKNMYPAYRTAVRTLEVLAVAGLLHCESSCHGPLPLCLLRVACVAYIASMLWCAFALQRVASPSAIGRQCSTGEQHGHEHEQRTACLAGPVAGMGGLKSKSQQGSHRRLDCIVKHKGRRLEPPASPRTCGQTEPVVMRGVMQGAMHGTRGSVRLGQARSGSVRLGQARSGSGRLGQARAGLPTHAESIRRRM